ncbi:hypothetical protein GCM10027085_52850 [Spirosoma aerophilum]
MGLAVGAGMYVAALFNTGLIVLILAGIKPIEQRLFSSRARNDLSITVQDYALTLPAIESIVGQQNIEPFLRFCPLGCLSIKERMQVNKLTSYCSFKGLQIDIQVGAGSE